MDGFSQRHFKCDFQFVNLMISRYYYTCTNNTSLLPIMEWKGDIHKLSRKKTTTTKRCWLTNGTRNCLRAKIIHALLCICHRLHSIIVLVCSSNCSSTSSTLWIRMTKEKKKFIKILWIVASAVAPREFNLHAIEHLQWIATKATQCEIPIAGNKILWKYAMWSRMGDRFNWIRFI